MSTTVTTTRPTSVIAVMLALVATFSLLAAAPPAAAAGPVSCFTTSQAQSTYSSFGIDLARHESILSWCRDNDAITSVSARRNEIVKVGVGNAYSESEWDNRGSVPSTNTWNDHYGRFGIQITIPPVGTVISITRTHRFDYDVTKTAGGSSVTRTSSSWYL